MGALMPFTSLLHLRGDSPTPQLRRFTVSNRASVRLSCSQPTPSGVDNAAEVKKREIKQQLLLAHEATTWSPPVAAKAAAATKADPTKLQELDAESEWDVYCDILPESSDCQKLLPLTPSWPICDRELEVESSEFMVHGSKKPQRLSSTSWDILD